VSTTSELVTTAGIDVGTSAVKVAIVDSPAGTGRGREGAQVLAKVFERVRRRDLRQVIDLAWRQALEQAGRAADDVAYTATTGEGELVDFRVGHFYGMTAHARGAVFLEPRARGTIDAGALHGRAIRFDDRSRVLDYRMTSQCASGSGQFLENIGRYLGVVLEEIGPLSLTAKKPEKISGICAVLAETDVINMVSRGIAIPDILKGIHASMAQRFAKLLKSIKAQGVILLTGGLSADVGLLRALNEAMVEQGLGGVEVRSHVDGVFAGALGAALWGAYRFEYMRGRLAA
jgi:benzoyl-CoA reductase subunit D